MKCLLDVDGVLADFTGGICSMFGIRNPYENPNHRGWFEIIETTGLSEEEFWGMLRSDFWANLAPTSDCFDILETVENRFGNNVCLLTAPPHTKHEPKDRKLAVRAAVSAMKGKMTWIEKHLPQYRRRYLMGPDKIFCANPDHWLVDDADHNVDAFIKHGGKACLIPRLWNTMRGVDPLRHLRMVLTSQNQEH